MNHAEILLKQAECKASFWKFCQHMVPSVWTDYKGKRYAKDMADKIQVLIENSILYRVIQKSLLDLENTVNVEDITPSGCNDEKQFDLFVIVCNVVNDRLMKNISFISNYKFRDIQKSDFVFDDSGNIFFGYDLYMHIKECKDVLSKIKLKLAIQLPPGAGKSLILECASAWCIGKYTKESIMVNSFSAGSAEHRSKDVRDMIQTKEYLQIFPHIKLQKDAQKIEAWAVEGAKQFSYLAYGPQGSSSGNRATMGLAYDDFVKNTQEASSMSIMDAVWGFYTGTHVLRTVVGTFEMIVGTRYSSEDVLGKILSIEPDEWDVIKIPGLRRELVPYYDENKNLVYKEEEVSFCEEVQTTAKYISLKSIMPHSTFMAVIQQQPEDTYNLIFPDSSMKKVSYQEAMLGINSTYVICDTADTGSDFLCSLVIGSKHFTFSKQELEIVKVLYKDFEKIGNEYINIDEYGNATIDQSQLQGTISSDLFFHINERNQIGYKFFVIDVLYTQDPHDVTLSLVAQQIVKYQPVFAYFESNKDGGLFSQMVSERVTNQCRTQFKTSYQTHNKLVRMIDHSTIIKNYFYFIDGHPDSQYHLFYKHLTELSKLSKNRYDDCGDAMAYASELLATGRRNVFPVDVINMVTEHNTNSSSNNDAQWSVYKRLLLNYKQLNVVRTDYYDYVRERMDAFIGSLIDNKASDELIMFVKNELKRLDALFFGI